MPSALATSGRKQRTTILVLDMSDDSTTHANQLDHHRSSKTEAQYKQRFRQLETAAATALGMPLNAETLTDYILDSKLPSYAPASWRVVRASLRHGLLTCYDADPKLLGVALQRINSARAPSNPTRNPKTSALRSKHLEHFDIERICHRALASRAPTARALVLYLQSANLCGLRPIEWANAIFKESKVPGYKWELIAKNAKHDLVRGNGATRTLRWHGLSQDMVTFIRRWLSVVHAAVQENRYSTLLGSMDSLMRDITKELFPKRKRRPTLYTPRHECAARWKAHYVHPDMTTEEKTDGRTIIAALMGHASDATATEHYGRPRKREKSTLPIPHPDPSEVATVRKRFNASAIPKMAPRGPAP